MKNRHTHIYLCERRWWKSQLVLSDSCAPAVFGYMYWKILKWTLIFFFVGFSLPFWIWRDPLRVSVTLSFGVKNRHTHIYFCERRWGFLFLFGYGGIL